MPFSAVPAQMTVTESVSMWTPQRPNSILPSERLSQGNCSQGFRHLEFSLQNVPELIMGALGLTLPNLTAELKLLETSAIALGAHFQVFTAPSLLEDP